MCRIGSHDDAAVLEGDRAALAVRHAAIVKNLEKNVENVRMGLFDLVEEDHRVGMAANGFREIPPLLCGSRDLAFFREGLDSFDDIFPNSVPFDGIYRHHEIIELNFFLQGWDSADTIEDIA